MIGVYGTLAAVLILLIGWGLSKRTEDTGAFWLYGAVLLSVVVCALCWIIALAGHIHF